MLYRPEAFEPLVDTPWSELRARVAIRELVEDAGTAFRGPRGSSGERTSGTAGTARAR